MRSLPILREIVRKRGVYIILGRVAADVIVTKLQSSHNNDKEAKSDGELRIVWCDFGVVSG